MTNKPTHTQDLDIESVTISPREWAEYRKLKAAAPDLLSALKMLAEDYDLMLGSCDPGSTAGIIRAAIAKAEAKP